MKDALEKEQQAAMEAEEACIKLEGKKNELEDEITVCTNYLSSYLSNY